MFATLQSNICAIPANDVKCLRACAQRLRMCASWMSCGGSVLKAGDSIGVAMLYDMHMQTPSTRAARAAPPP